MTVLSQTLNRTLVIDAPRDVVFRYFTDPDRWAKCGQVRGKGLTIFTLDPGNRIESVTSFWAR